MDISVKGLKTSQPTDLFYSPDWPNGSLYFWPVPATAYGVRLALWTIFQQFQAITDPIGGPGGNTMIPPAYRAAMMLSLAEDMLPGSKRDANQVLLSKAAQARMAVFGNNTKAPRIETRDSGVPGGDRSSTESNFNYKSRTFF